MRGTRGIRRSMGWEESMFAVFDDLEQQAAGLHLAERDAEVADLSLAEYSGVSLGARLHASLGREIRVRLVGGHAVAGRLAGVGEDWMLVVDRSSEWIVRHAGILTLTGLSSRADSEETWSVTDRLTLRAVLRRLSAVNEQCLVHFADDQQMAGRVGRVGLDFFELHVGVGHEPLPRAVPVAAVSALQGRTE
jgi:small nuclear ribonucleoprotein (snRNP)-like protein